MLFEKGDLVKINGKTKELYQGNSNNGRYVRLKDEGTINFNPKELKLLETRQNRERVN